MKRFCSRALGYAGRHTRDAFRFARDAALGTYLPECAGALARVAALPDSAALQEHAAELACAARQAAMHRFELLGKDALLFEPRQPLIINSTNRARATALAQHIGEGYERIDWQLDAKSGFRWSERRWHNHIRFGERSGVDVKVPWELSRLQHLPRLALAYAASPDEEWRVEFQNQTLDFLSANPPRFGVNWFCAMDCGIRAANILLAFDWFCAAGATFEEWFTKAVVTAMREHARHIRTHLEWGRGEPNNHLLAGIAGLLFLAIYLPQDAETAKWLAFARAELVRQTKLQFHPDGSNVEGSTAYHRLSAEMVVFATALLLGADPQTQFPRWYRERLTAMGAFTRNITANDGTVPQIGDNDAGRFFHLLPGTNELDHSEFAAAIDALFGQVKPTCLYASLVHSLAKGHAMAEPVRTPGELQVRSMRPPLSGHLSTVCTLRLGFPVERYAYPDFGLFVFKSPELYLAIRCSARPYPRGHHAHHDHLSIELHYRGEVLFRDPGTFVYTSDPQMRRRYRALAAHAVPFPFPATQNEPVFAAPETASSECLYFGPYGFAGRGIFLRTNTVERHLIFSDGLLEVVDSYAEKPPALQADTLPYSPGYGKQSSELVTGGRVDAAKQKYAPSYLDVAV